MPGTLYIVATPIGNLDDMSLRARRVLSEVALIACEDTRHTAKLLSHFGITTPTVSYHEHNEQARAEELLGRLQSGDDVALVSDAGTPLVSDPGDRIIALAIVNTIKIVPIPGPSALIAALTASGLPATPFHFAGFLSAKRTQFRKELSELNDLLQDCTLILYEAPHRIVEALGDIVEVCGSDRPVVLARELTKVHEEFLRGTASSIQAELASRPAIKGEITLLIGPAPPKPPRPADPASIRDEVAALVAGGTPRMDAIKEVARRHHLPKRDVYKLVGQTLVCLLAGLLSLTALPLTAGVASVWAVNDSEKVDRDDLVNPNKRGNSAWTAGRVRLFAARNEVVAFQVIVEADDAGIDSLRLSLPELKHDASDSVILYKPPASDPSITLDRPIRVYSVNYMRVTQPTTASWIYRPNTPGAPAKPAGWKPVQLIPENARAGRGGFPLKVEPGANQAIWIEIYTRKDLPAGNYHGFVTLNAGGVDQLIPVALEVFPFTLSDTNTLMAMLYYDREQPRLYQGRSDLDAAYHRLAHQHRVELVHAYDEPSAEAARALFDGSAFTPPNGYEGPGIGVGNRMIPRTFYGPGTAFDERESAWRNSDSWLGFLQKFMPNGAYTMVYMPDEPAPTEYPRIRKIAENIKSNPNLGKMLPVLVTSKPVPELDGMVDVWAVPAAAYNLATAQAEHWRERHYWTYNGGRPFAPAIVIDSPAADARAMIWMCFKHRIPLYFYWHTVHWRHNEQKSGERNQNVWSNPITFDNRKPDKTGGFANGDGVLLYPGTDVLFPENDRGLAGPIATIQLANFRRGLQDHLYLSAAAQMGLSDRVADLIFEVVPRAFSMVKATDPVGFVERGTAYESVRYRLARTITAKLAERATESPKPTSTTPAPRAPEPAAPKDSPRQ